MSSDGSYDRPGGKDHSRNKMLHMRNQTHIEDDESASDSNGPMNNRTFTKSDDEYEENFDNASEESRNGRHSLNNGTNEDYDDDNDLVKNLKIQDLNLLA